MINLEEHIVEIDGVKYIPYDVAIKATEEVQADAVKVDQAMQELHANLTQIQGLINTPIEDD